MVAGVVIIEASFLWLFLLFWGDPHAIGLVWLFFLAVHIVLILPVLVPLVGYALWGMLLAVAGCLASLYRVSKSGASASTENLGLKGSGHE